MKRITSIFFLAFYLLFSYGVVISAHYCGGEMVNLEIMQKAKSCCGDSDKSNECCSTDHNVIFLDDNQLDVRTANISVPVIDIEVCYDITTDRLLSASNEEAYTFYTDLPPPDNESVFLMNCSFIFYG